MRILSSLSVILLAALCGALPASAGMTFVVNSTADEVDATPGDGICATAGGACTLRAAVLEANALLGADRIEIPAGTYTMTIAGQREEDAATGDLDLTDDVTIVGAGAATTILDAAGLDRFFDTFVVANISGVTIRNGNPGPTGSGRDGGAIYNSGTLTLSDVILENNVAPGSGGGIRNDVDLTITDCTARANQATLSGGGIDNTGDLIAQGVTLSGNMADGAAGIGNDLTVTLTNVTVSGNTATTSGGGFRNNGAATLTAVTFAGNGAPTGGAIMNLSDITLAYSIIADSPSGGNCAGVGTITSNGHNLDSGSTCALGGAGDISNADPRLDTLKNNGGPTATHALFAGSPAIDAGGGDCPPPMVDQRGITRPADGDGDGTAACDIGAVEMTSILVPGTTTTTTLSTTGTTTTTLAAECSTTPSFSGVLCRLDRLAGSVQDGVPAGGLQDGLVALVGKAKTRTQQAEAAFAAGKKRAVKAKIGKALAALKKFKGRLHSRKAKSLPAGIASSLASDADGIRQTLITLRKGGGSA
jgi:CSLREA domain-containing protein